MHEIHNRMPVILEKSTWDLWLNPGLEDPDELKSLLKPGEEGDTGALPGQQRRGEGQ
jgi:putative SOS response-associated peptidase YedK